jgi:hypothetical protein
MHVLGHDHISVDAQGEVAAHFFQNLEKEIVDGRRVEPSPPVVTSEGHEVSLCGLLKTLQAIRHRRTLGAVLSTCSDE